MRILYLQHIAIEGPESLGRFLDTKGLASTTINLFEGQSLPDDINDVAAVICLGGPMNVDEEGRYGFLRPEKAWIRRVVDRQIPFLGICLGSQLLARSFGAVVTKSPAAEIGFGAVTVTPSGRKDPLFQEVPLRDDVFQWHEDMFAVPEGGLLLASSSVCPHQAFRLGENAYGLQFHIEVSDYNIREWAAAYWDLKHEERKRQVESMVYRFSHVQQNFRQQAERIYQNFWDIICRTRLSVRK